MNFVNNWLTQLTAGLSAVDTNLPITAESLALLPDGEYILTLSSSLNPIDAAPAEIVSVRVLFGGVSIVRAQEGTTAQDWPSGTFVYCAVTAGTLNKLSALIGTGGAIRSPISLAIEFVVSLEYQSMSWSLVSGLPQPFAITFPAPPEGAQAFRLEILMLNFAPGDSNCYLSAESAPVVNVADGVLVAAGASITRYDMLGLGGAWFVLSRTTSAVSASGGSGGGADSGTV